MAQTVHLVRHGEVENPKAIIYGRLPGFHLSERGRRQARAAGLHLRDAKIGAIWASPLERAQETARHIAEHHDVDITTDDRLLESVNSFEGVGKTAFALLRNPVHWWRFRNPMKPSWGESFGDIEDRMMSAVEEAIATAGGLDVVVVSHQTPTIVTRNALSRGRRRVPPWLWFTPCHTGSVTSLVIEGGRVLEATYFAPPDQAEAQN